MIIAAAMITLVIPGNDSLKGKRRVVTHDMDIARRASRVLRMKDGQIVSDISPAGT